MLNFLPWVPQKVNLFGNNIVADAIGKMKLWWGVSSSYVTGVLVKKGKFRVRDIHTQGDHVKMKSEMELILLLVKEHRRLPAKHQKLVARHLRHSSRESQKNQPWWHFDLQTSSLQAHETIHFFCLFCPICYGRPSRTNSCRYM